jgi:hypothetical protein
MQQLRQGAVELADRRIEVLINRRADGHDDGRGILQHAGVRGCLDKAGADRLGQKRLGVVLVKRHSAAVDQGDTLGGRVEQIDRVALAREGQRQGQADMAASADDRQRADLQLRAVGFLKWEWLAGAIRACVRRIERCVHRCASSR